MHPKITLATTRRVLQQLGHDKRTLALMFVVPCLLMALLAWVYSDIPQLFDIIGVSLLGIFPFIIMFLVTSITTLRERSSGTMERLLIMPAGRLDILAGYALAFGSVAIIQSVLTSLISVHLLGLSVAGPEWFLVVVALADALLGTTLGLFVSAFARTEFQAVQFMPAFILPQFLLCGLLVPVGQLPPILEAVASWLPLTYAVKALQYIAAHTSLSAEAWRDVAVIAAYALLAVLAGAATLRRSTK